MRTAKAILDEALELPRGERADVVRELIASLDGPTEDGVQDAWLLEAERRQREAGDDPSAFEDWPAVRERIAARLRAART